VEIDSVGESQWDELLALFDDATIQQAWAAAVHGNTVAAHLVLKEGDEVVGICQVAITRLRVIGGIADVHNGPLWRRRDREARIEVLAELLHAVNEEYAVKRGLLVRMWPYEFDDRPEVAALLHDAGFEENTRFPRQRTILLSLEPTLEELRRNLGKTWRNLLNRAERGGLQIIEGTEPHLYEIFLGHLREMVARKGFVPKVDYDGHGMMQEHLPQPLKMRVLIAENQGTPVASLVYSAVGDTGILLFGATADDGLKSNASNLLHWRVVERLKRDGLRRYDLGGIDPEGTPGTYQFKRGLGGKLGEDRRRVGQFEYAAGPRQRLLAAALSHVVPLRQRIRALRRLVKR
jgi:hypothetical protein